MEQSIIHTTVHLRLSHAMLLDESAQKLGLTRSKLATLLLRKMMKNLKRMKQTHCPVKYQNNIEMEAWKTLHVFFESRDYEVNTDMRKFFKWSVSALLAMALNWYIKEILEAGKENIEAYCDNYKVHGHKLYENIDKNKICWHTLWDLSEEFAKKFAL